MNTPGIVNGQTGESPVIEQPPTFFPDGSAVVGETILEHASIIIYGRSGVGKSNLGRQLVMDAGFGPQSVYFLMAEDNTALYGKGARVQRVKVLSDVNYQIDALVAAHRAGKRLPKVVFFDSISGLMDYARQEGRKTTDVRAAFGDMGYGVIDVMIRLRDEVPVDTVSIVTTYEHDPNLPPELSVEGRLVPKNLTRLSNIALYMKAHQVEYDPKATSVQPAAHRTIVVDDSGQAVGRVINRYFYTQDAGEIMAKGHHTLAFRERAILPTILRKIHGVSV